MTWAHTFGTGVLIVLAGSQSPATDQRLLAVPFFADGSDQCGPSALASVLTFWAPPVDPATLKKEIYLTHLKGSLPMDLLLAAQRRGFNARLYNGGIDNLKSELSQGHPLIAFTNRGFTFLPSGHFVVVTGYDEARQGLTIHSGMKKDRFITYRSFLKNWDKTERSTLLILPPEPGSESAHADL